MRQIKRSRESVVLLKHDPGQESLSTLEGALYDNRFLTDNCRFFT